MNKDQLQQLFRGIAHDSPSSKLIETHISWVILAGKHAYKIKKPVRLSFLDFSSLAQRKSHSEAEVKLNQRFAPDLYEGVVPVVKKGKQVSLGADSGAKEGRVIDYAIKMKRLPEELHLLQALAPHKVPETELRRLGRQVARMHKKATSIAPLGPIQRLRNDFGDLRSVFPYLAQLPEVYKHSLHSLIIGEQFLQRYGSLVRTRAQEGMYRDVHGDLHAGNVFLTQPATIFDGLEFDEELRQIDVMSELAFLTMDLEANGYQWEAQAVLDGYLALFPIIRNREEAGLFLFYQQYRAGVRLKVSTLLWVTEEQASEEALQQVLRYGLALKRANQALEAFMKEPSIWSPEPKKPSHFDSVPSAGLGIAY